MKTEYVYTLEFFDNQWIPFVAFSDLELFLETEYPKFGFLLAQLPPENRFFRVNGPDSYIYLDLQGNVLSEVMK